MFSKIKNALIKGKKKLLTTVAASFMTVTALAVSASAAESGGGTTPTSGLFPISGGRRRLYLQHIAP